MKRNILFLLSLCMLLLTCSDGNDPIKEIEKPNVETKDPFITLKKTNIDFINEGGSEAISIESNVSWTAKSSASWCTVSPSSGNKSTASITLSAPANEDYDNRSCTVTITGGSLSKTITVNQGENVGLLVTQDRYELSNEESTIKVEVKANVEFEVEINDEWITKVETRGLTTSKIEFKIAENDTYGNRDGSITIKQKGGGMTSTITIFQSQEDAIILSEKDFDISSEAQAVEVEIKTNIDYEIIIPEDAKDWVSHTKTRALRTETVVLDIADNKDYDDRTVEVIVKDKKTDLEETVTIKQAANTGIIVSEDKYELSNDGGTIEVEVKANVDFDIEISDKWITRVETRGLTTTNLTFEVAKNESYSNREGTITISQTDGDLSSTITVYQSQENAIILSEKEMEVSDRNQTLDVVINTNVDFDVTIKEDGMNWVSYIPTRGLREEIVTLNISANSSDKVRSTEVYIKDKQTSLQETLTITQMGKEPGVYYVERMGTLGSMLSQTQKDTITTMTVKGEINKADFDVMKYNMPQLKYIDLKEVKCEGDKIPVEALGGYYSNPNKIISRIILPQSVTKIGEQAFYNCVGLVGNLNLPEGLKEIDNHAFTHCSGLTGSLSLPAGLIKIGIGAFASCRGFTGSLTLPPELAIIEGYAFRSCTGFSGSLNFSPGLTTIEEFAFADCSGFTNSLTLPDGLTTIGERAFLHCSGFTGDLIIPDKVTTIGGSAFYGCSGLIGSLILSDGLTTIGREAFRDSGFTGNLIIPDGVTTIGYSGFYGCSGFTGNLIIPDGVTTIGNHAFGSCTGFKGNLILSEDLKTIGGWAFIGCSGFTGDLIIPNAVTTIGETAFNGCTGFTGNLILPDGLTTIGREAFMGCSGLTGDLIIPEGVATIGYSAFSGCSGFSGDLVIPDGLTTIPSYSFSGCSGFTGNLILPDGLTTINEWAFSSCTGFTGLTIGKSVATIYENAFNGCSKITGNVVFPESLASIRNDGFTGCKNVDAFQFPHTTPLGYFPNMLPSNATVKVPTEAVATYKATNGWKDYNIVGY